MTRNIHRLFKSCTVGIFLLFAASCYKDKGNYNIDMPLEPTIVGLDTVYNAIVGDSLIIAPQFEGIDPNDLECTWRIGVPEAISPDQYVYHGKSLRTIFGLQAKRYMVRLTLTNTKNGMKYFHNFHIQGITEFSKGSLVLSVENGTTQLSFIKPDSTVQARIYEAIHQKSLPDQPLSIHYLRNQMTGNTPLGYWIITEHDGIRLDVNNLREEELRPGTLANNFFLAPSSLNVGNLKRHPQGVLVGIINGKFYGGTTSTWDQANTYGMFGSYADGDYELASPFILSNINNQYSMIAFEKNKKQFIRLNIYGSPVYFGTQYSVLNTDHFNPQQVGMDLVNIVQINQTDTYAYCQDVNGVIQELKFTVNFDGPFSFTPSHKRSFIRQELFGSDTKILATRNGNIYIASGRKIYRYTPLNERVIELETTFSNPVTMLSLSDDESTLIAGTEGKIHYLAIQTGRNGDSIGEIDGIPGNPVDITWR